MRTLLAVCLAAQFCGSAWAAEGPVYELRVYTCNPGKLEALHARFRDHTMKLFEKHGIRNIAYWTPADGPEAENTLIYIILHESKEAAAKSWQAFRDDPEWQKVRAESEKDGKILAKAPQSTYMAATDYAPEWTPLDAGKVYELRIYTAAEGKLDALNSRFRDHTGRIFKKHGMRSVGYWVPSDEPKSTNTLVYVLAHDSRDAAKASWQAFGSDPEWKKVAEESQKDGRLLSKRPESTYMVLTDFSPRAE